MIDVTVVVLLFLDDEGGTDWGEGVVHEVGEEEFGSKVGGVVFFGDTQHGL